MADEFTRKLTRRERVLDWIAHRADYWREQISAREWEKHEREQNKRDEDMQPRRP